MTGSRIFISYRRGDSSAHAGRLSDRLVAEFGADGVFMDVDTIEPGADFVDYIDDAVGSCDVLIALIGDEWLECRDDIGNRRLEDPDDFVRLEVAAGLERDIRVVPVLVEGATMPRAHELPEPLRRLARRNALEITDTRWRHDVGRLVETIKKVLEGKGTGEAIREAEAEVAPAPAPEGATAAEAPATAGRPPWESTPAPAAEARPSYGTAPGGYEPTNPSYQDGTAGAYQPPPPPREGRGRHPRPPTTPLRPRPRTRRPSGPWCSRSSPSSPGGCSASGSSPPFRRSSSGRKRRAPPSAVRSWAASVSPRARSGPERRPSSSASGSGS
ncbi:MAG: toll/interleukin-1 receptor domain-containing protein [Thermoleophilaceae bacterium]